MTKVFSQFFQHHRRPVRGAARSDAPQTRDRHPVLADLDAGENDQPVPALR